MIKTGKNSSAKKLKKTKKRKAVILFSSVGIIVFCLAVFFASKKTRAVVEGWGTGIWNDLVTTSVPPDTGIPTIGYVTATSQVSTCGDAFSKKYSINIGDEDPVEKWRPITGSAWFGIGSQPDKFETNGQICDTDSNGSKDTDRPSLGWLNFSAGVPSPCPGDCYSARWYPKNVGGADRTGTLSGWANITSMGSSGWVRLRGKEDGKFYGVTSNGSGGLSGFAWNSGPEDSIAGNSGLGWIKMAGLKISDCKLGCATKQVCKGETLSSCDSSYCTGDPTLSCALSGDKKTTWTCSNASCGDVSCAATIIDPKVGVCGSLNGKYVCDPKNPPTADKLCSDASAYNKDLKTSGITATWTCGNSCSGGSLVSCSASARCGWTETAP